jgi:hypothetical protein
MLRYSDLVYLLVCMDPRVLWVWLERRRGKISQERQYGGPKSRPKHDTMAGEPTVPLVRCRQTQRGNVHEKLVASSMLPAPL